jgi:hypothetical protein
MAQDPPLNASQNYAFEELCCQLVENELVPKGARFVRKGSPDAGVECFWQLPNGDEWGWQAKFFVSAFSAGEWAQIDESVKTAIEKHPRLTKYTICSPLNLPDARIEGQKSALSKWADHKEKWKDMATTLGLNVEFVYWGDTEIWSRLSRDEHRGRVLFWFNEQMFPVDWFSKQIAEAIANAGPRYTPELNVDLPLARNFDGLGRTAHFYSRIASMYGEVKKRNALCHPGPLNTVLDDAYRELERSMQELLVTLDELRSTNQSIPFESALSRLARTKDPINNCLARLDDEEKSIDTKREGPEAANSSQLPARYGKFRDHRYHLGELLRSLQKLESVLQSKESQLANVPALVIVGDAGIGKTHLLCDIAQKRLSEGRPSVLVLGEHFTDEEPWAQIIKLVGLSCSRDDFLGVLDAMGAVSGRTLILIDALNEGEGDRRWPKYLAGFLETLSRHKHIGLAITVRTSFESSVIPDGLVPIKLIRVRHEGFSDTEYNAMQTFFDHYGIQHPSVPLLAPEFQNPLFLKIFCRALNNLGLTRIPSGLTGISQLMEFFLDSINSKLSKRDRLDFDPRHQIVSEAIDKLVRMMAARATEYLVYTEAQEAVDAVLPRQGFERSLFKNLISEGVLAQERVRKDPPNKYQDVIRFAYQRFTDHLIVRSFLDDTLQAEAPLNAFMPDSRLGQLFKDEFTCWHHRNLLDALCVQVPERIGQEVPDLLTHCANSRALRLAFVQSLIWRNPSAINEKTLDYINREILPDEESRTEFFDALLTIAILPEHPYNSFFLHRHLMTFPMAERDARWSSFLYLHYGEAGAIDRLIDWAWFAQNKSKVSDSSVLLAAIALTWFLTSSNRYLRDRATKALVSLLTPRIQVLRSQLRLFRDVNDLYVTERIYCAAYGCSLRSTDYPAIAELAQDVYEFVFRSGQPVPHVLLRDYARGIIEVALKNGSKVKIQESLIRPPYRTKWHGNLPSVKQLEKKYGTWHEGIPRRRNGLSQNIQLCHGR